MPQVLEKDKAILRVHAGEATFESGEKVELFYGMDGSPIATFKDGTTIYWTWEELIRQAIELKNKKEKDDKNESTRNSTES